MKRISILTWALCLCLSLSSANAFEAQSPKGPALWSVSDEDSTLYLFGTFHLLPPKIDWQTEAMLEALEATSITVLEVDTGSPEAVAKIQKAMFTHAFNEPGVTLSAILGPERSEAFFEFAEEVGVPALYLENQRPWFAQVSIMQLAFMKSGFTPGQGVEAALEDLSAKQGDSLRYLETPDRQIKALISLEDQALLDNFDQSMEEATDFKTQLTTGLDAWLSGDPAQLDTALLKDFRETAAIAFDRIFLERNREWVPILMDYLAEDQDMFVGVGAGHLVGQGSVIELLEDAGFKVQREF